MKGGLIGKKISLVGLNKDTGSVFEIEFKDKRQFSNPGLRDVLLYPNEERSIDKMRKIIKKNDGAKDFFTFTARGFRGAANDVENDLTALTNRILNRRRR